MSFLVFTPDAVRADFQAPAAGMDSGVLFHFLQQQGAVAHVGIRRKGIPHLHDMDSLPFLAQMDGALTPGKAAAFVRTKFKNVITGAVVERSFNPTDKYPTAFIERKDMQYSYNDGQLYYFMDTETYEQVPIGEDVLGDNFKFVKEEMICKICSYKGNVFAVEPPTFVELEITETEPGIKGDTATNATKPATLETGAEIRVPLFINEGDRVRIDTRTGEYMERA